MCCAWKVSYTDKIQSENEAFGTDLVSLGEVHYPPQSLEQLRQLHRQIVHANCQQHQKQSLLFYLLKDYDEEAANAFQQKVHLPKKYWIAIQGLWQMDRLQYQVRRLLSGFHGI
jgi:hypothetical protein